MRQLRLPQTLSVVFAANDSLVRSGTGDSKGGMEQRTCDQDGYPRRGVYTKGGRTPLARRSTDEENKQARPGKPQYEIVEDDEAEHGYDQKHEVQRGQRTRTGATIAAASKRKK